MIPVFGFLPSVLSRQAFNTFITDILNTQFSSRSSDWTSSRPTFWRSALLCGPWAELHVRNTHFSELAAARIATSVLRQWAIPTSAFLNTGLRPALHVVRFCAQRGHSLKSGRGAAHRKPAVLLAHGHLGDGRPEACEWTHWPTDGSGWRAGTSIHDRDAVGLI